MQIYFHQTFYANLSVSFMKFKSYIKNFYLASIILFVASSARAEVLFDSTSNPVFDYEAINQNIVFNASFTVPNYPMELKALTLLWQRGAQESGLIHIYILGDKNSTPGDVIEEISVINSKELPIGKQVLNVPLRNKIILNPQFRYWIKIQASDSPGALAYARQHGGYGVANEYYLNTYGLHKNSVTGPYLFRVDGDRLK